MSVDNLQKITSEQPGLSPVLMAAANSAASWAR
jgi:L-lactate permease